MDENNKNSEKVIEKNEQINLKISYEKPAVETYSSLEIVSAWEDKSSELKF